MKTFSKVIVIAIILALTVGSVIYAQTTANTTNSSNTTILAQAGEGPQGGSGMRGKKGGKRGGGQKGKFREAMFEAFKKYAGDPAFKSMLDEQDALMDSLRQTRQAKMKAIRKEMRDMTLSYAIKINNASSDDEEARLKQEMEDKFKEMRTSRKSEAEAAKTQMKQKIEAFKSKYESKFPDYFKVLESMKKMRGSRRGQRKSGGKRGGNKGGNYPG